MYDSTTSVTSVSTALTVTEPGTDLYTSHDVPSRNEEYDVDLFLQRGMTPCSPRWLADHADASVQRSRMMAQMGSLREAIAFAVVPTR